MRAYDVSKQILTKSALERLEALVNEQYLTRMETDSDLVDQADREYGEDLVLWVQRQSSRYFTRDELRLQCVVALRYADPARPTVRELWQYLQILIEQDARALPGSRKMRFPSYSTFYSRIADLPPAVWSGRRARAATRAVRRSPPW